MKTVGKGPLRGLFGGEGINYSQKLPSPIRGRPSEVRTIFHRNIKCFKHEKKLW